MAKEMQEGKLNPNEGKLKALQAAMAKIEKDDGFDYCDYYYNR